MLEQQVAYGLVIGSSVFSILWGIVNIFLVSLTTTKTSTNPFPID